VARHATGGDLKFYEGWNQELWFHLAWLGLGLFFLIAIRSPTVQHALIVTGRNAYRIGRFLFWDLPVRVWHNEYVQAVLATVPAQMAINYVVKPAVISGLLWLAFHALWESWPARVITFVAAALLVNSRIGRAVEAVLLEVVRGLMELVRAFPAVIRWVNDLFREMLDALEWVLARTEDWLRLRGRGGPLAVTVRAVAGVIWMPFAFLIRFYTVVLIEPMVNPIKLPLSILFAKVVYPLLLLTPILQEDPDNWMGYKSPLVDVLAAYVPDWAALVLVMGTLWLLPDACTFLFWEMRENWRLYKANRPSVLKPVPVGPHGETIEGLLHYGIHSGTVPRLFSKLRVAEREAARTNVWREARTHRQALRGVEEAIRQFVTRDFVAILNNPASAWGGPRLGVGTVTLGTNRIRLEVYPDVGRGSAWLEWEDRSGWLVAGWAETGFLADLSPAPRRVLENALAYLYKRAGVDVIREQVRAELPKDAVHFDIAPGGMLVWYGSRESTPMLYDLAEPVHELRPRQPTDRRPVPGPTLDADRVIFSRVPLTWSQWTEVWKPDPPGQPQPRFGPDGWELALLPPRPPEPPEAPTPAELPPAPPAPSDSGNGVPDVSANGPPDVSANGTGHEPPAAPLTLPDNTRETDGTDR
jgi:hypothetical protein